MIYVIDFAVDITTPSERLVKWKAFPREWQVCLVHEGVPKPIALNPNDVVFAHDKHFRSDLTDAEYETDTEVHESLTTLFKGDKDRVRKGIDNVLTLRTALRKVGHAQAPRLGIFSGADLSSKAKWMREDVCKVSLPGFPKEKVIIDEHLVIPRNISSEQLERLVSSIISLPWSTTSPAAAASASERLWTIYLLCDAYQLNEGCPEKVHDSTILRSPISPEQWFRPLGKSPCDKSIREIAAEVPTPEAAMVVAAFLKKVAKSRPTAGEVRTTMTALGAALRIPSTR